MRKYLWLLGLVVLGSANATWADHAVLVQGNNTLAQVNAQGEVEWEMKWAGIHDIHLLPNGNIMVQQRNRKVVEIHPRRKKVVWEYDAPKMNGNEGKK